MSDLLDRVPATIPGLVQPGSLTDAGRVDETLYVKDGVLWCVIDGAETAVDSHDLNDRTSRVHAVWWARSLWSGGGGIEAYEAVVLATWGYDMTPEQIDTLARLVLRLAEEVCDA